MFNDNNVPHKPGYLDHIDELEYVSIVRLKGNIDIDSVPALEERLDFNRKKGSKIEKNVLVDYRHVGKVDSAAVAFHLVRLKEYEDKGFKIGFINASEKLMSYLNMFHLNEKFRMYANEREAVNELNRRKD